MTRPKTEPFRASCIVLDRKRRWRMDWPDAIGYAWRLHVLDTVLSILDNPLPQIEKDLIYAYESLFCQR